MCVDGGCSQALCAAVVSWPSCWCAYASSGGEGGEGAHGCRFLLLEVAASLGFAHAFFGTGTSAHRGSARHDPGLDLAQPTGARARSTYNPPEGRGRKSPVSKEQAQQELLEVVSVWLCSRACACVLARVCVRVCVMAWRYWAVKLTVCWHRCCCFYQCCRYLFATAECHWKSYCAQCVDAATSTRAWGEPVQPAAPFAPP